MATSTARPRPLGEALADAVCAASRPAVWLPLWCWVSLLHIPGVFLPPATASLAEAVLWILSAPFLAGWVAAGLAGADGPPGIGWRLRRLGSALPRTCGASLLILLFPLLLVSVAFGGVVLCRLPAIGDVVFWIWCLSGGLVLVYAAWRWLFPGLLALPLGLVGGVLDPCPSMQIASRSLAQVRTRPGEVAALLLWSVLAAAAAGALFAAFIALIAATLLTLTQAGDGVAPGIGPFCSRAAALVAWLVTPGKALPITELSLSPGGSRIWAAVLPPLRDLLAAFLVGAFCSGMAVAHRRLTPRPLLPVDSPKEEAGEPSCESSPASCG